ncbi:hypothetical protein QBC38DRAFT_147859 [Podospora fimiseda]|uniref:Uncharacterized protein n=1 Tax=Podospora fimiseda TaxID=252190 RepID=A0AAN7GWQ4_9PEZI|nr:hypothetical protein QBC38DRAFT_147859 [Podospora fimiseda]
MFAPHGFKEGRDLRKAKKNGIIPEITLEDFIDAMDYLLRTIHFKLPQQQQKPEEQDRIGPREIARIAVQTDKYDLHATTEAWRESKCTANKFPMSTYKRCCHDWALHFGYAIVSAKLFRAPGLSGMVAKYIGNFPFGFESFWARDELISTHLDEEVIEVLSTTITATLEKLKRRCVDQVLEELGNSTYGGGSGGVCSTESHLYSWRCAVALYFGVGLLQTRHGDGKIRCSVASAVDRFQNAASECMKRLGCPLKRNPKIHRLLVRFLVFWTRWFMT